MEEEIRAEGVGPMPVEDFIKLIPLNGLRKARKTFEKDLFANVPVSAETSTHGPIIEAVNKVMTWHTSLNTSSHEDPDSTNHSEWKIDLTTYGKKKTSKCPPVPSGGKVMDYNAARLLWEIKKYDVGLPFREYVNRKNPKAKPTVAELEAFVYQLHAKRHRRTRGQAATFMAEVDNHQFRTHVFFVLFCDPLVCFIRQDHAGFLISSSFNAREDSSLLHEFLLRFDQATDEQQGFDGSVRLATPGEISDAEPKLIEFMPQPIGGVKRHMLFRVVDVPQKTGGVQPVVIQHPIEDIQSLTGRCTRGFSAYDVTTGKIVFLKDYWRPDTEGMEKEADILDELHKSHVENIPTLYAGGDVLNADGKPQRTLTQMYGDQPWRLGPRIFLDARVHHRITIEHVPNDIHDFKTPRAMLSGVEDAYIAHQQAYERCHILHRDISDNNVRLTPDGRGRLCDWDLCLRVEDKNGDAIVHSARQRYRTGTWTFMSHRLLQETSKVHELADDLESIFFLVLFLSVAHLDYSISGSRTRNELLQDVFDERRKRDDHYIGGDNKKAYLKLGAYFDNLKFPKNPALTEWIKTGRLEFRKIIWAVESPADMPEEYIAAYLAISARVTDHAFFASLFTAALGSAKIWDDSANCRIDKPRVFLAKTPYHYNTRSHSQMDAPSEVENTASSTNQPKRSKRSAMESIGEGEGDEEDVVDDKAEGPNEAQVTQRRQSKRLKLSLESGLASNARAGPSRSSHGDHAGSTGA